MHVIFYKRAKQKGQKQIGIREDGGRKGLPTGATGDFWVSKCLSAEIVVGNIVYIFVKFHQYTLEGNCVCIV